MRDLSATWRGTESKQDKSQSSSSRLGDAPGSRYPQWQEFQQQKAKVLVGFMSITARV
jgi:hypothetical protein